MKIRLPFLAEVIDKFSRENFKHIDNTIYKSDIVQCRFVFYEKFLSANSYPADVTIVHDLGFIPRDVITLSILDGKHASLLWNYAEFTRTTVHATISAEMTVRYLLGRFEQ